MALDTYDGLKAVIADTLDRDDLTSQIDDFIDLAETRHKREIRIREMLSRSAITVDDRQISLPTGFLEMKTLRLLTDPVTVLEEVNLYEMNRIRTETTDKPAFFTVHAEIEFDVTPAESYSGEIIFYKDLTPLDSNNPSNAILSRAPDAYLYGSLVAATPFLNHDERLQMWVDLYEAAREGLNGMDNKRAGPLISRVAGATP